MAAGVARRPGAAYVWVMWWKKKPEPPLRDQLVQACANVRRQLEVLKRPVGSRAWNMRAEKAELEAMLLRLEQELADLDGAEGS